VDLRVGIHQPNYIPWIGYFQKIAQCDIFVFFDNAALSLGKSYVSRVEIITATGRKWLTVPIRKQQILISNVQIIDTHWQNKHLKTLETAYARSEFKDEILEIVSEPIKHGHKFIADLNISIIKSIYSRLGFDCQPKFMRASELGVTETGRQSIENLLESLNATTYVTGSGTGTKRSIDENSLNQKGINVSYIKNTPFEYVQLGGGSFEAGLSIIDLLFSIGPASTARFIEKLND